jgi:nucleotide-binding universal stress UspA family protein
VVTKFKAELTLFHVDRCSSKADLAQQIADLCNKANIDIVMMAGQSHGILRRLAGRPILHDVLRKCRCAVWTARGRRALGKSHIRKVACALDLSDDSVRVLCAAKRVAEQWDAGLSIVHAMPEMDESLLQLAALNDLPIALSPDLVRKEVSRLQLIAGTGAELHTATSGVATGVKRILRRLDADLLVIGPGRNAARSGVLGTNVKRLVSAAPCPVLVLEKLTLTGEENSWTRPGHRHEFTGRLTRGFQNAVRIAQKRTASA